MRILLALILALPLPGMARGHWQIVTPTANQWFVNVASGSDSNSCLSAGSACKTVAAAVTKAADDDTISMAAGIYPVNNLQIDRRLTIEGAGRDVTFLDGGGSGRLLYITSPSTITDLTIRNGAITTPAPNIFDTGGGAVLSSANLTLRNARVAQNSTVGSGGAIFNLGQLTIEDSEVLTNTSEGNGGGIYNYSFGTITINRSLLAGNIANGQMGGAIESSRPVYLTDVTIRDNESASFGGGLVTGGIAELNRVTLQGNRAASGASIFASFGAITLTNSTISGNLASNNYGGIQLSGSTVSLVLQNSTIAYNSRSNSAGAGFNGLITSNSPVRIINSIIAFNSGKNCGGTQGSITSDGHNLSNDFSCSLNQTGDLQGVDALLGPLGDYGGVTPVHPLLAGSPAIDAGDNSVCPSVDQRHITRPIDGDGNNSLLCDIGPFESRQQLSIADVIVPEGNSGTTNAVFTVTLAPPATQNVTVSYATSPDSASPGSDYTTKSGTLSFSAGQSVKTVPVPVTGDTSDEQDETFFVRLSNASGADIVEGTATGTIVDDDGLSALSIDDQTVLEGNSGTKDASFTVSLSPASAQAVSVNYSTVNGTASAGADYNQTSGVLTFTPGQTTKTVAVPVLGDVIDEGVSENFTVTLSSPVGAAVSDGDGLGIITDDDTARLSQSFSPEVLEGDSGQTPMIFTITLSTPAAFVVTVDYGISSGPIGTGAVLGEDFNATDGTLTFQPGQVAQNFTAQVIGDTLYEPDELFTTIIRNGSVPISANGAFGRILNDDNYRLYLPLIVR